MDYVVLWHTFVEVLNMLNNFDVFCAMWYNSCSVELVEISFDLNVSLGDDVREHSFIPHVETSAFSNTGSGFDAENLVELNIPLSSSPEEDEPSPEEDQLGDSDDGDDLIPSINVDEGEDLPEESERSVQVSKNLVKGLIKVGRFVDTLDEVHVLYREYGRLKGFSVRKGTQSYFLHTKLVHVKFYHCSCEGSPDNKCSKDRVPVCKRQSYRCHCNAKLRVCREDVDSPWKVTIFETKHSHKSLHPSESYLLRSARNMSQSKKMLLIALTSSGIGVSRAYRFLENEAGSRANIEFLPKDIYNELHKDRRKMMKVANGDANKLLEYFTAKGSSDPSFFWKVKVGDDGRLKNLLFRDTRCLIDYQYFGDVVSVDATYKTNKYDLICVPIIGINHHRTNVLFAMAFLSNENTESYEWLFSAFLESMYRKEPTIIFSDQDQALMNGLDNTFCQASHRLCQWNINKNAGKQFGKLNYNKEFKRLWYRCMNGCEGADEFETSWARLIEEFNLMDNKWFKSMYNLRKRWSSAFTLDKFSGGLHATSRSEVTNKVIKELCSSTSSVYDFVLGFEKMQKNWRTTEFEEDALCRGMPGTLFDRTGIMQQLGELCTRSIFKIFEAQVLNSITVKMSEAPLDLNVEVTVFKVCSSSAMKGYRVVRVNHETKRGTCSCHMLETEDIICRHLFKVYFHLNLDRVPDEMVLNRWRRDAKEQIRISDRAIDIGCKNNFSNMVFVNYNIKRVYDLLSEVKENGSCRDAINKYIGEMIHVVRSLANGPKNESKEPLHRPIRNPSAKKKRVHVRCTVKCGHVGVVSVAKYQTADVVWKMKRMSYSVQIFEKGMHKSSRSNASFVNLSLNMS
ncbi:protein FAR1-RELATED SEQUENCE 5-like [Salvia miltiorrhiza]|uniref:protein FAR1-RELATED SEQUENCE 5-like n=1 Tax=Salvia miltiorrhiza TaxID=226208 RepID=UPI0025ABC78D|nr:protein FAR1-RELATED SEQUENCE 5-like [Salvia miltiorrhiza]